MAEVNNQGLQGVHLSCARCSLRFTRFAIAPVLNPELCASCWLGKTPPPMTDTLTTETQEETNTALTVRDQLRALPVSSPDQIAFASELLVDVKGKLKHLEERLAEITKPLNAALKSARDLFRPAVDAYGEAEVILKQKIAAAHEAIAAENRRAMLAAQEAMQQGNVMGAALATAAIAERPQVEGVRTREAWTFRVVDARLVPREFLVVDEKKIRAHVAAHGDAQPIPGVSIEKTTQVIAARGR